MMLKIIALTRCDVGVPDCRQSRVESKIGNNDRGWVKSRYSRVTEPRTLINYCQSIVQIERKIASGKGLTSMKIEKQMPLQKIF